MKKRYYPTSSHRGERKLRTEWIFGIHASELALKNPKRKIMRLFLTEDLVDYYEKKNLLNKDFPIEIKSNADITQFLTPHAVHQGIALEALPLEQPSLESFLVENHQQTQMTVIVLDQVTDPHNIGAILRSAAAFKANAVIVTDRGTPDLSGTIAKVASGAVEVIPFIRVVNLARALEVLKEEDFWVVGLDETGSKFLSDVDLTGRIALLLGSEGTGLRRLSSENCDFMAKLPTHPPIGSLNVSNAAAISLYEAMTQRHRADNIPLLL